MDFYLSENNCYQRIEDEFKKYGKLIFCVDFDDTIYDFHKLGRKYDDVISLIENAEVVISSSFHATAFSHIFHKKFGVILPNNNGERLQSLLELSGLKERIIEKESDINRIYKAINYEDIDIIIGEFINKSKELLIKALK